MTSSAPTARIRGAATGLLTAALAVAAHGVGGGAPPSGAAAVQLAILASTVGALAASLVSATHARVLIGLLGAGQLAAHLILGASGHHHPDGAAVPSVAMLGAHLLAVAAGEILIAAGDRLWRAVSRTVRAVVRSVHPPVLPVPTVPTTADQPLRSALMLAASMSHRGPPVSLAH
jgi:hypothetical protein